MNLTPIFPAHIKPVRVGVYKVANIDDAFTLDIYAYWDGKRWSCYCSTVARALECKGDISRKQNKRWQGILK